MPGGRCLVLNADYSLIHVSNDWYHGWELVTKQKATPLAEYDAPARSDKASRPIPAVVVLRNYVRIGRKRGSFTFPSKRNLWVRDGGKCAYCGCHLTVGSVTKDHVMPTSRGGKDVLTNVVASCWMCNNIKADRTPKEAGMTLRVEPRELTNEEKIEVLVKTHKAQERTVWLQCLRDNNLTLF